MHSKGRWVVAVGLIVGLAACAKHDHRGAAAKPADPAATQVAPQAEVATPAKVAPPAVDKVAGRSSPPANANPQAVDPTEDPSMGQEEAPDPIEAGLDSSWKDKTEGCKAPLDDKDRAFQKAYGDLCQQALSKARACFAKPAYIKLVERSFHDAFGKEWSLKRYHDELEIQFGDASSVNATCGALTHDQLCNGGPELFWTNGYPASALRRMAGAADGDCAAIAKDTEILIHASE